MNGLSPEWNGEVSPEVQAAIDEFRNALEKLRNAQDTLLIKVLREEAMSYLYKAADISMSGKIKRCLGVCPPSIIFRN